MGGWGARWVGGDGWTCGWMAAWLHGLTEVAATTLTQH